ncbi:hypothetical protein K438DRAFT_1780728 [Mycena galopus ATCC 62051]|nr:hypothetical protein K438DRAFT_1780728 [Mycena galopus ATCC 62051]
MQGTPAFIRRQCNLLKDCVCILTQTILVETRELLCGPITLCREDILLDFRLLGSFEYGLGYWGSWRGYQDLRAEDASGGCVVVDKVGMGGEDQFTEELSKWWNAGWSAWRSAGEGCKKIKFGRHNFRQLSTITEKTAPWSPELLADGDGGSAKARAKSWVVEGAQKDERMGSQGPKFKKFFEPVMGHWGHFRIGKTGHKIDENGSTNPNFGCGASIMSFKAPQCSRWRSVGNSRSFSGPFGNWEDR